MLNGSHVERRAEVRVLYLPPRTKMKAKAKEIADRIDSEWWKSSSRDTFVEAADKLLKMGWSEEDTEEFLSGLYSATADCYGG